MNKRKKIILLLCLLAGCVVFAFSPVSKNSFVNWDDDIFVCKNNQIRTLSFDNIRNIFTSFHEMSYYPIALCTYALEYHFFKLNPTAYHLTSLFFHMLNCLLVFWLIMIISKNCTVAFITALFFGVHPLRVESVAWISERRDVLFAFFLLASIISYCYYCKKLGGKAYFFSILLFIISLFSKVMGLMLPLLLFIFDYIFSRKISIRLIIEKIPFFLIALIFGSIALIAGKEGRVLSAWHAFDYYNISTTSFAVLFYLEKTFFPVKLACVYPYFYRSQELSGPLFLVTPIILLVLVVVSMLFLRHNKKFIFGSAFFIITIFPVVQRIVPPVSELFVVADRYLYLSSIGILYVIAELLVWLYTKKILQQGARIFFLICFVGVIATDVFLTRERCTIWKDSLILWSDVIKNYPNVEIAYLNRGEAFLSKGKTDMAYLDFSRALVLNPHYADAYYNRAAVFIQKKEYENGIINLKEALRLNPAYSKAYAGLGAIYSHLGKQAEAIESYTHALENDPFNVRVYVAIAEVYGKLGDDKKAVQFSKKAIALDPANAQAYTVLCPAYGNLGNMGEAINACKKALEIDPLSGEAYFNLSVAYYYTGNYALAIVNHDKAVALKFKVNPDFSREINKCRQ